MVSLLFALGFAADYLSKPQQDDLPWGPIWAFCLLLLVAGLVTWFLKALFLGLSVLFGKGIALVGYYSGVIIFIGWALEALTEGLHIRDLPGGPGLGRER